MGLSHLSVVDFFGNHLGAFRVFGKMAKFGANKFRQYFSKCTAREKFSFCIVLLDFSFDTPCTLVMHSANGIIGKKTAQSASSGHSEMHCSSAPSPQSWLATSIKTVQSKRLKNFILLDKSRVYVPDKVTNHSGVCEKESCY